MTAAAAATGQGVEPGGVAVDPAVALALLIVAATALVLLLWNARRRRGDGRPSGSGGGRRADRLAAARRHSTDGVDADAVAAACAASGEPWRDPSFGHDRYPGGSIGNLELRDGERGRPLPLGDEGVSWQPPERFAATPRPMGVRGDGVPTWLYSDEDGDGIVSAAESMEADDALQGSVGDCYFLAALSAVVQRHPDLADDLIDETHEEQGIYGVSLWRNGRWRMTWVDSYFPCYRPSSRSRRGKHRLLFAGATDRKEIWPLVVEKAFAKVAGSYEAISGGHTSKALEMLTGGRGRRRAPAAVRAEWERFKEEVDSDEHFVGAGSQQLRGAPEEAAAQKKALKGIVTGHAYTVLAAYEDGDLRLVELRNPWGRGEWTGDWGAGSRRWKTDEGRRAVSVVGPSRKDDGRFWMAWEDFAERFDSIDTCRMNFTDEDRARRAALREEAARIVAEQDRPTASAGGGGEDEEMKNARKAADAMMEQLLAEEAKEKRKKQAGAKGMRRK